MKTKESFHFYKSFSIPTTSRVPYRAKNVKNIFFKFNFYKKSSQTKNVAVTRKNRHKSRT
jgi:hypothetical protein